MRNKLYSSTKTSFRYFDSMHTFCAWGVLGEFDILGFDNENFETFITHQDYVKYTTKKDRVENAINTFRQHSSSAQRFWICGDTKDGPMTKLFINVLPRRFKYNDQYDVIVKKSKYYRNRNSGNLVHHCILEIVEKGELVK